jgi:hypothetical protein
LVNWSIGGARIRLSQTVGQGLLVLRNADTHRVAASHFDSMNRYYIYIVFCSNDD